MVINPYLKSKILYHVNFFGPNLTYYQIPDFPNVYYLEHNFVY